jgi:nicotinate-nucleotide--dimethylbenzimidazole phosphoribosyltransferase
MEFYDVVHGRCDVRAGFLPDVAVADAVLRRVLTAAHAAPSVGLSQPWDFLVLRDYSVRARVHELVIRERDRYAASLPSGRARISGPENRGRAQHPGERRRAA